MKKYQSIILIGLILLITILLWNQKDYYPFNNVTEIYIEINNGASDENWKKENLRITDTKTIQDLVKPLKNWKFQEETSLENCAYPVNYYISLNNGVTITLDKTFSKDSCNCFIQINGKTQKGCVPDKFIQNLKTILKNNSQIYQELEKEYPTLQ